MTDTSNGDALDAGDDDLNGAAYIDWLTLNSWVAEVVRGDAPIYHITWKSRLTSIRKAGLKVGGSHRVRNDWMGGDETRERCRGFVFLTGHDRIDFWSTMMCENLDIPTKNDHLVLLEVDAAGLPVEHDPEYPGDVRVAAPVGPERIRSVLADDPWLQNVEAWLTSRTWQNRGTRLSARRPPKLPRGSISERQPQSMARTQVKTATGTSASRPRNARGGR
jgi:hypothetical protein